ncbi:Acetyltransferase [Acaryochloris thomasi RCC1774]|uniref:Acetyltransferase n=1 Tax=Acaryochloris thomasi RCC1774 TaxID=1764569 RepID=A0A2W1JBM6_9CYAN|nr:GNAT family N-acetyltransferase [Acaryochloris thomasi]PZD71470.1 Acetyltransferase [Acaryochloris thomasi RCC1774]
MLQTFKDFVIRDWQTTDRIPASEVIRTVLTEYGLGWEPDGADIDVVEVEKHYRLGEFWVVEHQGAVVGTAAYYPVPRGEQAVEIRKMYLQPQVRGGGLGRFLLRSLESRISEQGFRQIWVETASVLVEAVQLYETSGYKAETGVETVRCDRIYTKRLPSSS